MTKVIEGGGPYNLQIIFMESWCTIQKFHVNITRGSGLLVFIEKKTFVLAEGVHRYFRKVHALTPVIHYTGLFKYV